MVRVVLWIWLLGALAASAPAAFTSLYVFGDGVCTTTNNPSAGPYYYGLRRTNGRIWIEVLAQRQGIPYEPHKNWSFYGHYSSNLVANVRIFQAPPDAATALFVIWVNNADFVDFMGRIYPSTNIVTWTNAMNRSLSNYFTAITNLYHAKGARTFILPNAVDIAKIPQYNQIASAADKAFIRQRVMQFNAAFSTTLIDQIKARCPAITIYVPDIFGLLDHIFTNAPAYGLTNALYNGQPIDALGDPALRDKSLNGPGANYIFWDPTDPTAKAHAVLADYVQQIIAPVRFGQIAPLGSSNRLEIINVPIGRDGFVQACADVAAGRWTPVHPLISTQATQSVLVPASEPIQFYRLCFPFAWSWP
jgi:phospholipase/lecithinase/hemolysin